MDVPRDAGNWTIDIEEGMKDMDPSKEPDRWQRMSIFKVPPYIRSLNIDAYKPRVVSFGPFHHGKEHLKPMEAHKRRALFHFLKRSNCTLKDCCDKLETVMLQLMEHYEHLDEEWQDKDRFLELMVVDGCFLLEFLSNNKKNFRDYDYSDPIFGHHSFKSILSQNIRRDMFLIENQLPLIVLQRLLAPSTYKDAQVEALQDLGHHSAEEDIEYSSFSSNFSSATERAVKTWQISEYIEACILHTTADTHGSYPSNLLFCPRVGLPFHVLSVLQNRMLERTEDEYAYEYIGGPSINTTFPSATELFSIGVKFCPSDFWVGIRMLGHDLRLPYIGVDENSEAMFLNLIALEQLQVSRGQRVSSYVAFMGLLIRSADDVKLLRDCNVISKSSTLSDRAIAKLFNDLAKNPMVRPDLRFSEVREDLKHYYEKFQEDIINLATRKVNEKMADWGSYFKQTYCRNPWTVMGLAAAIIILVLTAIQTIYTVLQFYRGNNR